MTTKRISFLGVQNYDLILYLSQIFRQLKYKVLLIDQEQNGGLMRSMPFIEDKLSVIQWNGVDYTSDWMYFDLTNYDIILSCNPKIETLKLQDIVYFVTDLQLQNIEMIKEKRKKLKETNLKQELIIRDYCNGNKQRYVENECMFQKSHYLLEDSKDLWSMLSCQYNDKISFRDISKDLKNFLLTATLQFHQEKKQVKKAYKRAERGKRSGNSFLEQCSWSSSYNKQSLGDSYL